MRHNGSSSVSRSSWVVRGGNHKGKDILENKEKQTKDNSDFGSSEENLNKEGLENQNNIEEEECQEDDSEVDVLEGNHKEGCSDHMDGQIDKEVS